MQDRIKQIVWDNVAIVALTRRGMQQGRRLQAVASGATLYLPERFSFGHDGPKVQGYRGSIADLLVRLFAEGRPLVVFAALGLVVRVLAPLLRDKRQDPGVVVADEEGRHAISVLSGHRGGGNEVASAVAQALGGVPVITTASDAQQLPPLDCLGQEHGWQLEDESGLTPTMAALVNGDPVLVCQEAGEPDWWKGPMPSHLQVVRSLDDVDLTRFAGVVLITDRLVTDDPGLLGSGSSAPRVVYRPRTLVAGIGCERGVTKEEIEGAVRACLGQHRLSFHSLFAVGSIDLKRDEPGLLAFAGVHRLHVRWCTAEELRQTGGPTPSAKVLSHVGTPGVAEPAALLGARGGSLIVPKTKIGRVTVAIARATAPAPRRGCIFLIGLGPGDRADLTPRALAALTQADAVVGYQGYIRQIEDLLGDKEVIPGELGRERERAEQTVMLAERGKAVALVSSGDIGIYGMAGPLFEVLAERGWDQREGIGVEVVPGITALSACAALLGAPMMQDFAAISLSDYLTPWFQIVKRLHAAARTDFVIVLYNPKSASRVHQFAEACRILLQYRTETTPVGLVTRAGRAETRVIVTTLAQLDRCEVDMETTIMIGSSSTRLLGDRMVTPRGQLRRTAVGALREVPRSRHVPRRAKKP